MNDFFENLVYSPDDIITFPSGIPGFEHKREFLVVSIPEYKPFEWLVCTDGSQLRFAIINPLIFAPDYNPALSKEQLEDLKIEKPEDIIVYSIVTIKDNPLDSTANLTGPVFINKTRKIGKQIIVDDVRYSTREPILRKK
ncbi:MAG: flagellar assembly protein FliW [Chitinispirillaceae bacterium]